MDAFLVSTGIVALAEIGDKTQVAAVAVVAGTTLGMMLANVPAVYFGDRIAGRLPLTLVHGLAALIFLVLGAATLLGAGRNLGF